MKKSTYWAVLKYSKRKNLFLVCSDLFVVVISQMEVAVSGIKDSSFKENVFKQKSCQKGDNFTLYVAKCILKISVLKYILYILF